MTAPTFIYDHPEEGGECFIPLRDKARSQRILRELAEEFAAAGGGGEFASGGPVAERQEIWSAENPLAGERLSFESHSGSLRVELCDEDSTFLDMFIDRPEAASLAAALLGWVAGEKAPG